MTTPLAPADLVRSKDIRVDLKHIADLVPPKARVLDIGCGHGSLLAYLSEEKQVIGRGIELSTEGVQSCLQKGLSVLQGDADQDLTEYPDHSFDFVILSQTLQATHRPKRVLEHMARIGRQAIVSFPNFAHWRVRAHLFFKGRMPVTNHLSYQWWETPNIHFCTIQDFILLSQELNFTILQSCILDETGRKRDWDAESWQANLKGDQAVFLLKKAQGKG